MTAIPIYYNLRHMKLRKLSTATTVLALASGVLVVELLMGLIAGVEHGMSGGGNASNLIVLSRGAIGEQRSELTDDEIPVLRSIPEIAQDERGMPVVSPEFAIQFVQEQLDGVRRDAMVRGVTAAAFRAHPGVKVSAGGLSRLARGEVLVGRDLVGRLRGARVGESMKIWRRPFTVGGVIDSGGTSFDTEIWMNAAELRAMLGISTYNSVHIRVAPGADIDGVRKRIENAPQLSVKVMGEREFYDEQLSDARITRRVIIVGAILSGMAAALGVALTMFGAVARRAREIAVIRALGFPASAVLISFLIEASILGVAASLIALPIAAHAQQLSYVMPGFRLNVIHLRPSAFILLGGSLVSAVLGLIGGWLPAHEASRTAVALGLRRL